MRCVDETPSLPVVYILQRLLEPEPSKQSDRILQVVAFLTGDAQFGALDLGLHLQFAVLDFAHQLTRQRRIDALTQSDRLAHGVAAAFSGFPKSSAPAS